MKNKAKIERRRNLRFRIPTLLKYKVVPGSTTYRAANIRNVSVLGMAFLADRPLEKGVRVELHFLDPDGATLEVKGSVLRCERIGKKIQAYRIGVQFEEVPAEASVVLQRVEKYFLEELTARK